MNYNPRKCMCGKMLRADAAEYCGEDCEDHFAIMAELDVLPTTSYECPAYWDDMKEQKEETL